VPHPHRSTKLNGDIQRKQLRPLKPNDPRFRFTDVSCFVLLQHEFSKLSGLHHLALGTKILSCVASAYQPGPADEFKMMLPLAAARASL
jgi:hypothetical protein